ncbi:MAG: hypothetical protein KAH84_07755 [Thiomargarita sp.]|nr:hypothetical protein [Thiomargarita sp.]
MATGTEIALVPKGVWLGTIKPFVVAHPIGMAVVGGALIGVGAYYLMKKFADKKEETTTETTAETAAA